MTGLVWETAINLVLENEGGYVNDPKDPGGETKYGISKKQYPNIDIPNLTLDQAKRIYYEDYWLRNKCDRFPDCISVCLFDFCVNSNAMKAKKLLQKCLKVKEDGIIGNQTIGAAHRLPLRPIIEQYCDLRRVYLMSLKGFARFGGGWLKRVNRVQKTAEMLI
jgi:lysozyme family protein